jgi:hypothetical protein
MKRVYLIIILSCAGWVVSCAGPPERASYTKQDYDEVNEVFRLLECIHRIEKGMTLDEVRAVMGKEPVMVQNAGEGNIGYWGTNSREFVAAVWFGPGAGDIEWEIKMPDGKWQKYCLELWKRTPDK